jgi:membrane protein
LFVVGGQRPRWLLVAATLLSVWAASGAMMSLMEGFRAVYRIPHSRPFVRERGMAMLLVFLSALPILAASGLIVFSNRTQRAIIQWLGLSGDGAELRGWVRLAGQLLSFGVAVGGVVVVTGLVYYFGPNRKQSVRNVIPGALLATALWLEATLAFSWYVRNISNYNVLYGGVGAGLALLVWMYVLAVTLLLGCEYNARREKFLGLPPA